MEVRLEKATNVDAQAIFDIQVKAFLPLLEKYKDYGTSSANETTERVLIRINNPSVFQLAFPQKSDVKENERLDKYSIGCHFLKWIGKL
ncbi:hypothetical protein [Neobacillus sp. LXY-1]|uniref:hypothetical protein n=1 Tax=Neobacillus sp. LXY-1 TaxID=3379133 RepID=UPI003EE2AE37